MITSLQDLEEYTAFERWTLEALVPLPQTRPHTAVKDVEANEVRVTPESVGMRVFAGGAREVYVDLRPLAFGAAWKLLDLLLEQAFWQAGHRPDRRYPTIEEKAKLAREGRGLCPPLSDDLALWRTLCAVYDGTKDARHSLIHRLAEVDSSTGTLTGRDRSGQPLSPLSATQIEAFCRAAQRVVTAALRGHHSPRESSDLAWQLDQLQSHHQKPPLGGVQLSRPPLILVTLQPEREFLELDVEKTLSEGRISFPTAAQFDVTVGLPDGRWVIADLETLPRERIPIDLEQLPSWLQVWAGPGHP